MSLAVAEKELNSLGVPFAKERQGFLLRTISPRTSNTYHIFMTEDVEERVKLTSQFCPSQNTIERSEQLCQEMNKSMDGVALHYSEPQKIFYVCSSIPSRSLAKNVHHFLVACDFVFPLCDRVSKTGVWDANLAYLARCSTERIARA